jgi:hypothetical protein
VALGNRQEKGEENVMSTYSPVARMTTLRLLLKYCLDNNLSISNVDIKTAFLLAELSTSSITKKDKSIFCSPPPMWRSSKDEVWKLNR